MSYLSEDDEYPPDEGGINLFRRRIKYFESEIETLRAKLEAAKRECGIHTRDWLLACEQREELRAANAQLTKGLNEVDEDSRRSIHNLEARVKRYREALENVRDERIISSGKSDAMEWKLLATARANIAIEALVEPKAEENT